MSEVSKLIDEVTVSKNPLEIKQRLNSFYEERVSDLI